MIKQHVVVMPYDPVFLWTTCFFEKMTNFADQAFFQMFRGDLISRMTAKQIFRGIKFRGFSRIWPKSAKSAKFNPREI